MAPGWPCQVGSTLASFTFGAHQCQCHFFWKKKSQFGCFQLWLPRRLPSSAPQCVITVSFLFLTLTPPPRLALACKKSQRNFKVLIYKCQKQKGTLTPVFFVKWSALVFFSELTIERVQHVFSAGPIALYSNADLQLSDFIGSIVLYAVEEWCAPNASCVQASCSLHSQEPFTTPPKKGLIQVKHCVGVG